MCGSVHLHSLIPHRNSRIVLKGEGPGCQSLKTGRYFVRAADISAELPIFRHSIRLLSKQHIFGILSSALPDFAEGDCRQARLSLLTARALAGSSQSVLGANRTPVTICCEVSVLVLPEGERSRLESLTDLRILDTFPEQVFDDLARLAALICDTPIAVVDFVDEKRVWFKAKIGLESNEIPREQAFSAYAILQSDALIVPDPLADERFANILLVAEIGVRFYAGIPLIPVKGQGVGTLAVMDRIPHLITAEQLDSLTILARRVVHELNLRRTREVRSAQRRPHLAPSGQRSASILLVEDNDNLRILLQRTLEGAGFSVLSASNGAEAVRLSQQHDGAIHLTVSDIVMPQLNGLQMTDQIRATRPEMKFLFITGFADEFPELRDAIKNGGDVLEKPFLPSELMAKAERILSQKNLATGTEG
jgi:CheY-like chemotaxis protein